MITNLLLSMERTRQATPPGSLSCSQLSIGKKDLLPLGSLSLLTHFHSHSVGLTSSRISFHGPPSQSPQRDTTLVRMYCIRDHMYKCPPQYTYLQYTHTLGLQVTKQSLRAPECHSSTPSPLQAEYANWVSFKVEQSW